MGSVTEPSPGEAEGSLSAAIIREVDRHTFDRILLTLDMVPDHLPDAYLAALQRL